MEQPMLAGLAAVAIGALACAGGIADWDWFMNNYRARLFVRLLGRQGARIFYVCLGSALIVGGVLGLLAAP